MLQRYVSILLVLICISFDEPPKTWTAIGDSITYLNEHADETGNRITKGYMTMVTDKIPGLRYINKGYNGWTSGDIARDIEKLGLEQSDLYTIFLGTNDWWQGRPLGTIHDYRNNTGNDHVFGSFRIIIDKLRALNPSAHILLMTPLQRGDFVYVGDMHNNAYGSYKAKKGQTLEQFANAILAIGKEAHIPVIDLYHKSGITLSNMVKFKRLRVQGTNKYKEVPYPTYLNKPFDPAHDEYPYPPEAIDMTYDGLHPSDKGYVAISRLLIPAISTSLK